MKQSLFRMCWVHPYHALLVSLGLCIVTVAVSLLYLEDASLKMPHDRLQHLPTRSITTAAPSVSHAGLDHAQSDTDDIQVWPIRVGVGRSKHGAKWADPDPRDALAVGSDVKVLNNLEIVARNISHHSVRSNYLKKESWRLRVVQEDGSVVIPPHLLNAVRPEINSRKRYIIYLCHANISCCGWGDRQHGILSTYVISLVTNRTFGVEMSSPCPLTNLFHPRLLDWKINASSLEGLSTRHIYAVNDRVFRQVMQTIDFDAVYPEDVVYLTTNYDYFYALRSNPHYSQIFRRKVHGKPRPVIFADLWQNVFKLNKRVRRRIDRAIKMARPTPHHKLICGHVRLGRNPSIPNDSEVRNTLHTIRPLWKFLSHFKDPKKYRIFVPSDSEIVRSKVLDMFPGQAVDVKGDIMHIDKSQVEDGCVGFEKVLADQYLLSTCDVLVLTYSVFGKSAAYMRRSNHDLYFMDNSTIKPLRLFKEKT